MAPNVAAGVYCKAIPEKTKIKVALFWLRWFWFFLNPAGYLLITGVADAFINCS
jgi:hypothetical protein